MHWSNLPDNWDSMLNGALDRDLEIYFNSFDDDEEEEEDDDELRD